MRCEGDAVSAWGTEEGVVGVAIEAGIIIAAAWLAVLIGSQCPAVFRR